MYTAIYWLVVGHRLVETLTVGVQWIWALEERTEFEGYLEPVVIAKLINETFLVCGLCLVMASCGDQLFASRAAPIDIITDSAFLDFMDDQIQHGGPDMPLNSQIFEMMELSFLKPRAPTDYIVDFTHLS